MLRIDIPVPAFNVLKFLALSIILWPICEKLTDNILLLLAKRSLLKGGRIRFSESKFGPIFLHGKYFSRRTRVGVYLLGIVYLLINLLLEFSFDAQELGQHAWIECKPLSKITRTSAKHLSVRSEDRSAITVSLARGLKLANYKVSKKSPVLSEEEVVTANSHLIEDGNRNYVVRVREMKNDGEEKLEPAEDSVLGRKVAEGTGGKVNIKEIDSTWWGEGLSWWLDLAQDKEFGQVIVPKERKIDVDSDDWVFVEISDRERDVGAHRISGGMCLGLYSLNQSLCVTEDRKRLRMSVSSHKYMFEDDWPEMQPGKVFAEVQVDSVAVLTDLEVLSIATMAFGSGKLNGKEFTEAVALVMLKRRQIALSYCDGIEKVEILSGTRTVAVVKDNFIYPGVTIALFFASLYILRAYIIFVSIGPLSRYKLLSLVGFKKYSDVSGVVIGNTFEYLCDLTKSHNLAAMTCNNPLESDYGLVITNELTCDHLYLGASGDSWSGRIIGCRGSMGERILNRVDLKLLLMKLIVIKVCVASQGAMEMIQHDSMRKEKEYIEICNIAEKEEVINSKHSFESVLTAAFLITNFHEHTQSIAERAQEARVESVVVSLYDREVLASLVTNHLKVAGVVKLGKITNRAEIVPYKVEETSRLPKEMDGSNERRDARSRIKQHLGTPRGTARTCSNTVQMGLSRKECNR